MLSKVGQDADQMSSDTFRVNFAVFKRQKQPKKKKCLHEKIGLAE